jgi:hypothetical protein
LKNLQYSAPAGSTLLVVLACAAAGLGHVALVVLSRSYGWDPLVVSAGFVPLYVGLGALFAFAGLCVIEDNALGDPSSMRLARSAVIWSGGLLAAISIVGPLSAVFALASSTAGAASVLTRRIHQMEEP